MHAWSLSGVQLFVTPWTVACQAPLSMGFSRQEYWNGLPCPPPGDLPNPGIKPRSSATLHCRQILLPLSYWGICCKPNLRIAPDFLLSFTPPDLIIRIANIYQVLSMCQILW